MNNAEIITEYTETQATVRINFYYSNQTHLHTISYTKGQKPKLETNQAVKPNAAVFKLRKEIIQYMTSPYTLETFKDYEQAQGESFRLNDDPELIQFATEDSNLTITKDGIKTKMVNFTRIGTDAELQNMLIEASRHCRF